MEDFSLFLSIAIILFSAKIFGLFSRRLHLPQVVGALLAGIIIGPNVLNLVGGNTFLAEASEIGVILIMFTAGLEVDLSELKSYGKSVVLIAILGVLLSLVGGYMVYALFFTEVIPSDMNTFLENVFIGLSIASTSVGITVESLREMGKLKGKVGTTILGAAIIDDLIGIILLTVIIGLRDSSVSIGMISLKILLFFIVMVIFGYIFYRIFDYIDEKYGKKRRIPIYSIALVFLTAFVAEHFFGVADITGAFFVGLILSNIRDTEYINKKTNVLLYMFFAPIFFSSVGISMDISGLSLDYVWFILVLIIVAIAAKIIGCGFGAYINKYSMKESLQVGTGLVSRGEVVLIVIQKGLLIGLINPQILPSIVVVILATMLLTPIMISYVFKD